MSCSQATIEKKDVVIQPCLPKNTSPQRKSLNKVARDQEQAIAQISQCTTSTKPNIDTSAFEVIPSKSSVEWLPEVAKEVSVQSIIVSSYEDVCPAPLRVLPDSRHPIWRHHLKEAIDNDNEEDSGLDGDIDVVFIEKREKQSWSSVVSASTEKVSSGVCNIRYSLLIHSPS